LFNDLWDKLLRGPSDGSPCKGWGGYYPEKEYPYVCNEIEMDYDEAVKTFWASISCIRGNYNLSRAFMGTLVRTVFPLRTSSSGNNWFLNLSDTFWGCSNLETISS